MLYSYADLCYHKYEYDFGLFRAFIGTGLGNLLVPWAKSIIAAKEYDLKLIYPTWVQFHIGPLLRLQKDKRIYHNLFKTTADYKTKFKKIALLLKKEKISEEDLLNNNYDPNKDYIVVFNKMHNFFKPTNKLGEKYLHGHATILEELLKITRSKHKKCLDYDFSNSISLHVRCGENLSPELEKIRNGEANIKYPIEWYCNQIKNIRAATGSNMRAFIFSDGSDKEILPLLQMDNVERITFGTSIADMLALSRANILITSSSSFSKWASFLGRMPVIWHTGQLKEKLYYDQPHLEIEQESDSRLPQKFIAAIS